ncbi:MAG: pseudouridine synthase [Burkholderiales bacterium]
MNLKPPVFKQAPQPANASESATATPSVATTRLNKRMAELGLCSRREADDWIAQGWVRVDGAVAVMGLQVTADAKIEVERAAQRQQLQRVTILLHKPMGYVSAQAEDGHLPAVTLINPRSQWAGDKSGQRFSPPQLRGLAPAGRLDIDSVGLLVLTQDGRVARQLIGEDSGIEKEYLVRVQHLTPQGPVAANVQASLPPEQLARLRHGLSLDGKPLLPAKVSWQNEEQLRVVLREGKKRQIRRMCEQVGLQVTGLKRIRIGRVTLGDLPAGQWRFLRLDEAF